MQDQSDDVVEKLASLLNFSEDEISDSPVMDYGESRAAPIHKTISIESSRFHGYEQSAPPWRTLAVDASLKSVLDCGAFLVVLFKLAFEVWQLGTRRAKEGAETQVQIVRNFEAARQRMAALEFDAAQKAAQHLSEGDLALLDRPLCLRSTSSPRLKQSMELLVSTLKQREVDLIGVCKSSRLQVETGAPIIGFLLQYARKIGITGRWFYHPLAQSDVSRTLQIGEPYIASLNPAEDFAFRIDLGSNITNLDDAKKTLGAISSMGDRFGYGYPYPLRSVHEACAISRTEVDMCRQRLLEKAAKRGILGDLKYALKATSFREEVLLS